MDALLQELLNSPLLPRYRDWMRDYLAAEQQRREQFYATLTRSEKVEFINGEVITHTPVTIEHAQIVRRLRVLIETFAQRCQCGTVGDHRTLVSLSRNDYMPDICFFNKKKAETFSPHQIRFPAPDLAAEVLSPSTEKTDRAIKCEDYAAHGVTEYWIIDPDAESLEQYILQGDTYELLTKSGTAEIVSVAVEDFIFPTRALFDNVENQSALRQFSGVAHTAKDTHAAS